MLVCLVVLASVWCRRSYQRAMRRCRGWVHSDLGSEPTSVGSSPHSFLEAHGFLYFSAQDDQHGRELWRTDGTAEGTSLVRDLRPGRGGSNPVLLEADDMTDPAADCLRGLLDGHLVLARSLAERGQYPALDPLQSLSRLMPSVADPRHLRAAQTLKSWLALYEEYRDLVEVGAYRKGTDAALDRVLQLLPRIRGLLAQDVAEHAPFEPSLDSLFRILDAGLAS